MALIVAVDDVNAALRAYVLHWSNGDNAARWPDYQAAAGATLDEIAAAVRRISADTATILHDAAARAHRRLIPIRRRYARPPATRRIVPALPPRRVAR